MAMPAMGPTTAPAIQALDDELVEEEDDWFFGVVAAANVGLVLVVNAELAAAVNVAVEMDNWDNMLVEIAAIEVDISSEADVDVPGSGDEVAMLELCCELPLALLTNAESTGKVCVFSPPVET